MSDRRQLIAEAKRAARGKYRAFGHPELLERLIAELEAVESEHPSDCTCGYGGFHEPLNTRCEAYRGT